MQEKHLATKTPINCNH